MTTTLPPPPQQQKPKTPFLVRRTPFFYGWMIVALTFSTSMVTAGISGYGLSFFVVPMSEALGVTRAEFSSITLFRLAAIPLVPFLGMLVDRREGPRLVIVIGSTAAGLSLIASSFVQNMWQFYLTFGIFFGIAMMAMGGQLVGPAVLAKWFVKRRARVMAISAIGISGGGFVIAPIAGQLVEQFGWRDAWVILGIGMILIIAPAAALLMRRQPSDVGLMPDGIGRAQPRADAATANGLDAVPVGEPYEYPWTVREATRTLAFWALLAAQVLSLASLMPILFHQVAYMQDKGFSLGDATLAATTLAGFAIPGQDRLRHDCGARPRAMGIGALHDSRGTISPAARCRFQRRIPDRVRRRARPDDGRIHAFDECRSRPVLRAAAHGRHTRSLHASGQHRRGRQPIRGRLDVATVRQLRHRFRSVRRRLVPRRHRRPAGQAAARASSARSATARLVHA